MWSAESPVRRAMPTSSGAADFSIPEGVSPSAGWVSDGGSVTDVEVDDGVEFEAWVNGFTGCFDDVDSASGRGTARTVMIRNEAANAVTYFSSGMTLAGGGRRIPHRERRCRCSAGVGGLGWKV